MPDEKVPMRTVDELEISTIDGEHFDTVTEKRQQAKETIEIMKATIAGCDAVLERILTANKVRAVVWRDEFTVARREGSAPRRSIDPVALMQHGVAPSVIEMSTVYGKPGKPGITVRKLRRDGTVNEEVEIDIDGVF